MSKNFRKVMSRSEFFRSPTICALHPYWRPAVNRQPGFPPGGLGKAYQRHLTDRDHAALFFEFIYIYIAGHIFWNIPPIRIQHFRREYSIARTCRTDPADAGNQPQVTYFHVIFDISITYFHHIFLQHILSLLGPDPLKDNLEKSGRRLSLPSR